MDGGQKTPPEFVRFKDEVFAVSEIAGAKIVRDLMDTFRVEIILKNPTRRVSFENGTREEFDELAEKLGAVKPARKAESGKSPVFGASASEGGQVIA